MGFDAQFNHEFFIAAEAGVVGSREPDFSTLEAKMADMSKLRRESDYYFCGVGKYATGLYIPHGQWNWANNCPSWLSRGDEVYTLSFWANRQKHVVSKERWHKSCWDTLKDSIIEAGIKLKQQIDENKAKEDFELALYRSAHPIKPGRRSMQESHNLTDEQVIERKKIIAKRNTYRKLVTKYLNELQTSPTPERTERLRKQLVANNTRIKEFEDQLIPLGGLPGTPAPATFVPAYDALTQSVLNNPDYYDALEREHYYEGGDIDYNDANEDKES